MSECSLHCCRLKKSRFLWPYNQWTVMLGEWQKQNDETYDKTWQISYHAQESDKLDGTKWLNQGSAELLVQLWGIYWNESNKNPWHRAGIPFSPAILPPQPSETLFALLQFLWSCFQVVRTPKLSLQSWTKLSSFNETFPCFSLKIKFPRGWQTQIRMQVAVRLFP